MNKKILFIVNVDWFFVSHRLPIAQEAIKKGYEVHLACAISDKKEYLESMGIKVHNLSISRSGKSIKSEINTLIDIYKLFKDIKPNIAHFVTIKPVLYGGIVSRFFSLSKRVFSISGLGYVFISKGIKAFILKSIVKFLYKLALSGKNTYIIVQNGDDKKVIEDLNVVENNQIRLIRGSGVDLGEYKYTKESDDIPVVVMACRLLRDKGVYEYINAIKILKKENIEAIFKLYGDIDEGNPATLTLQDIENIKKENIVEINGYAKDMATIFSNANIVVLPSYREGLPKVLIEASSCGRAVVTTNVAGCKDAIEDGITGLLCEVKDEISLANAIKKLILDKELRNKFGIAGRELAKKEFDIKSVIDNHFLIYEGI